MYGRFPEIWNTGVIVTEENKTKVYRILKNMLLTVKMLVVFIFSFLIINSSLGIKLPMLFAIISLIIIFGSIIFFGFKLKKVK